MEAEKLLHFTYGMDETPHINSPINCSRRVTFARIKTEAWKMLKKRWWILECMKAAS